MGFFDSLLGGGVQAAGEGVGAVLSGAGTFAKDIRSAITGEISPEKKAEIESKLMELDNALMLAQTQINIAEAASGNRFDSGWRPFIGWVCGVSLAYQYILRDMIAWAVQVSPPAMNSDLITILLALLGMGTLRTMEKSRGVNR